MIEGAALFIKNILLKILILLFVLSALAFGIFFSQSFADSRYDIRVARLNSKNLQKDIYSFVPGELKLEYMPFVYNSLYSLNDIKDPINSISILKSFKYLICGEPDTLVEKEIQVADAIKEQVKIFGYINLGGTPLHDINEIKHSIDSIAKNGWFGVFIDQYGYDFGETRSRQNEVVNYAHSLGLKCFVNGWFIDESLGEQVNEKSNPQGEPTALGKDDWYLLESFYSRNDGYGMSAKDFVEKCKKAQSYKEKLGIKIAVLSYKRDVIEWNSESAKIDIYNSYLLALISGFDGYWYTDHLESDSFIYGKPSLDIGKLFKTPLVEYKEGLYYAKTDKYDMIFDYKSYPEISFKFYR